MAPFNSTERTSSRPTCQRVAGYWSVGPSSRGIWRHWGGPEFLHDQLHTDYVADDAGTYTVQPVAGGALAALSYLSLRRSPASTTPTTPMCWHPCPVPRQR